MIDAQLPSSAEILPPKRKPNWGWEFERNCILNAVSNQLGTLDGNSLDLGCGSKKAYRWSIGVDICRGPTQPWGYSSSAEFIWDLNKPLPFADNIFDWISCIHTLEHLNNPNNFLLECLRVLKAGGLLGLIIPDVRFVQKIGERGGDITHKFDWTPETFIKFLGEHRDIMKEYYKDKTNQYGWELYQYDTLKNDWSFEVILRKRVVT